jgi:alpha/beta superfamily hydrolase
MTTTSASHIDAAAVADADARGLDTNPLGRAVQSLYIDSGEDRVLVVHHRPAAGQARDCAVVLCPPFGWEEEASHRSLRAWANQLSAAGYPATRLTYPGTGDSSGLPSEPGRLDAWSRSLQSVADWVRGADGVRSVIALGMGFGSLVAYHAAATGTALDGLVLWAPPAKGREIIRQLRAFSRMEHAESFANLPAPPPAADGEFSAGGFMLSAETIGDLEALDLVSLQMAGPLSEGALLLDRDGIGAADKLRDALVAQGIGVSQDAGAGYAAMTLGPQESRLSATVAAAVRTWLDDRSQPLPPVAPVSDTATWAGTAHASLQLEIDGVTLTETPIDIPLPSGTTLSAVLVEPPSASAPLCAVFLNAGAIDRTGPSRMWVETARRWAALHGVPSLRLDIEGIGESGGSDNPYQDTARLHDPELIGQVGHALDHLQHHGVADRFVLISMCAGAFWSFHVTLDDPRVSTFFSLNQRVLVWDDGLGQARDLRRVFASRAILRVREADSRARVKAILRWMWSVAKRRVRAALTRSEQPLSINAVNETAISRLLASDARATFVFAKGEALEDELERWGRLGDLESSPNITVERIAVVNHTLRPLWAQDQTREILDRGIERELRLPPRG